MSVENPPASPREAELIGETERLRSELARANRSSQADQHRLQSILDSATDVAIIALDLERRVTFWSEGAHRIFGWTEAERLGRPADAIYTEHDRRNDAPQEEMRASLKGGVLEDERWRVRKDGSGVWASCETTLLRDEAGVVQGFVKALRDRTEQRNLAELHRRDAEFLRSILAASGDCIKVLDLDAKLLFMTEGGQQLMEVSDFNAIRGCPWPDFWQGELQADALAAVTAARAGGVGHLVGRSDTMAGTSKVWDVQVTPIFDADGKPEKLLSVSRDITLTEAAHEALRAKEEHWQGLFERLQEGFIHGELVRDPAGRVVDWRYLEVNAAWAELVGVSSDRARGRTLREVFDGVEDKWVDEMAKVVATRQPATFTRQVGSIQRWYEGRAFPLEGDRFGILFLEATVRKAAEVRSLALLDLYTRLRDLDDLGEISFIAAQCIGLALHVSRAGYATIAADGVTATIEQDWTSQAVTSSAGVHHMRDYGSYIEDLIRGEAVVIDDAEQDQRTVATAADLERLAARSLVDLPIIEQGRLVAFFFVSDAEPRTWTAEELSFIREVASHARATIERRRAEHRLRDLAASLEEQVEARTRERDRVWTMTADLVATAGLDGYLKMVNPAWTRTLGWSEQQVLSRPFMEIVHPGDHAATTEVVRRLAAGEVVRDFTDRVLTRDGASRAIMWTAVPDPGTDLFHIVGRDLTEQRQMEEALRQSQKMEAVGQLTGGLAHDFNNLLTGIAGSLELLETRIAQGRLKDVDRYIAAAQGAAKRAAGLTHRLLAFSRRQTLDPSPTNINRLVAGMEELIRRTVGPAIHVEVVEAGGLWTSLVDPNQLENALLNLCINARDAMPEGGRITIETANKWLDTRAATERELPSGQYLSLCVTDTGTGMTPEVIARAFDPFFTTKPLGEGTGLGLSMIYGFARQSGGQVRIYSEQGQGTTMCIYLPRFYGEEVLETGDDGLTTAPRAGHGEAVLVVDDEPTVRMLVTEVLEDLGYAAIEASDGPAGLRVLQSDVRVDLLVTDVGLPGGMNGRQVADAARLLRPDLKVLFITGYAENAAVGGGHLEPGMHLLTKPFSMEALASRIRDLIAGR